MPWYVINSKPRQEQSAEQNLRQLGVDTFCPMIKERRIVRRKSQVLSGPLFPRYLFARFDIDTSCRAVTYARGVRNIVSFGTIPATVNDEVIEGLRARLEDGCINWEDSCFRPGQVVSLKAGPLLGLEAIFERKMGDGQRVVLLLRALAYQARIVVPTEYLAAG